MGSRKQPNWSVGEISISYRVEKKSQLGAIRSSKDAFEYLAPLFEDCLDHREKMMILHLSRSSRIIGHSTISIGGLSGTVCDPKIIFQYLLKSNAAAFIMAHNHPSGNLQPSSGDKQITKRVKEAGKMLDISLLDHLILGDNGLGCTYQSAADEWWL